MSYLAVAVGAALGGFIQSITGFGAAVVIMTVLPYFFSMRIAPSISTSICLVLTGVLAWKFRKSMKLSVMLLPTVIYAIACVASIRLLGNMDLRALTIAFGVFLILLGGYSLVFTRERDVHMTVALTVIFSVLAGACAGLFSIGGPFMAIYFLAATKDRDEYLGNIQPHFFINNAINMATRAASGYYSLSLLPCSLLGITAAVIGNRYGMRVGEKLDAKRMRSVVYGYVMLSGVITVVQQLLQ